MRISRLDKLFGGKPGSAEQARQSMRRTYGPKKGDDVFRGTIAKRELKAKRGRKR